MWRFEWKRFDTWTIRKEEVEDSDEKKEGTETRVNRGEAQEKTPLWRSVASSQGKTADWRPWAWFHGEGGRGDIFRSLEQFLIALRSTPTRGNHKAASNDPDHGFRLQHEVLQLNVQRSSKCARRVRGHTPALTLAAASGLELSETFLCVLMFSRP